MRRGPHILISEWIIIIVFVVMVVATSVQVFCRYVLGFSLPWADELSRYCLVWMVFIGMVVAFVRGQQVAVDLLLERYRGGFRPVALTLIDLSIGLLFGVLLYGGWQLMDMTGGQTTPGLGVPKSWVYLAVPVGAALMLIELALRIVRRLRGIEEPARQPEPKE